MSPLSYVSVGFAPGLFWLWQISRRSRNRPDHKGLVLRTFLLGVVLAVPTVIVEGVIKGKEAEAGSGTMLPGAAAFMAFVVAGFVEELAKFSVVRATMYRSPYFVEPLQGLIYSSAVALGFASIENVGYMVAGGPVVIVPRAILATLGHVFFSSAWGYALGAHKHAGSAGVRGSSTVLALGVFTAIAAHGAYDFFLFLGADSAVYAIVVFLCSGAMFATLFSRASEKSLFRGRVAAAVRSCPKCHSVSVAGRRFCTTCGTDLDAVVAQHRCGSCAAELRDDAAFCTRCGHRVERSAV